MTLFMITFYNDDNDGLWEKLNTVKGLKSVDIKHMPDSLTVETKFKWWVFGITKKHQYVYEIVRASIFFKP